MALAAQSTPDIATEFKYGSIGTEGTVGVPYWLWKVLPEVFADKLPNRPGNGYERIGFTYDNPKGDLPMGASKSNDWVPRVGLNCATCHVGQYREAPGAAPKIVLGMPAHQMDLQAYARFLSACAKRSQVQRRYPHRRHAEASGVRIPRWPHLPVVRD